MRGYRNISKFAIVINMTEMLNLYCSLEMLTTDDAERRRIRDLVLLPQQGSVNLVAWALCPGKTYLVVRSE